MHPPLDDAPNWLIDHPRRERFPLPRDTEPTAFSTRRVRRMSGPRTKRPTRAGATVRGQRIARAVSYRLGSGPTLHQPIRALQQPDTQIIRLLHQLAQTVDAQRPKKLRRLAWVGSAG